MIKGKRFRKEIHPQRSFITQDPLEVSSQSVMKISGGVLKKKEFSFIIESNCYGYNWLSDIIETGSCIHAFILSPTSHLFLHFPSHNDMF